MFGLGIKAGDNVVFKKNGVQGKVLDVAFDSAFVEFVGNRSGETQQTWVLKSKLRKAK